MFDDFLTTLNALIYAGQDLCAAHPQQTVRYIDAAHTVSHTTYKKKYAIKIDQRSESKFSAHEKILIEEKKAALMDAFKSFEAVVKRSPALTSDILRLKVRLFGDHTARIEFYERALGGEGCCYTLEPERVRGTEFSTPRFIHAQSLAPLFQAWDTFDLAGNQEWLVGKKGGRVCAPTAAQAYLVMEMIEHGRPVESDELPRRLPQLSACANPAQMTQNVAALLGTL